MVSRGRSSDRARGGAHSWPSPIVPKFPSRGNFGDDGHVAFGTESGFPKFPHFKIFRWRLCIWQSSPCLALLFQKSVSQNDLPDLDSLVQIKNRDTKSRVRTVVAKAPPRARLQLGLNLPLGSWMGARLFLSTKSPSFRFLDLTFLLKARAILRW